MPCFPLTVERLRTRGCQMPTPNEIPAQRAQGLLRIDIGGGNRWLVDDAFTGRAFTNARELCRTTVRATYQCSVLNNCLFKN